MRFQKAFSLLLIAALFAGVFGPGGLPVQAGQVAESAGPGLLSIVKIENVPPELVRRAAQLIEDMRGSEMAPNWENARLLEGVRELYRPDVEGVAYYEFEVIANREPAGFIIVSTGPHDFPIPHWDSQGTSPGDELDLLAARRQMMIGRYYRLDALTYAAEDEKGSEMVSNSDFLVKIDGIDPKLVDDPLPISENTFEPPAGQSEENPSQSPWKQTQNGPEKADYKLSEWESWDALKQGYASSYAAGLKRLGNEALQEWAVEMYANEFGELLSAGDQRTIAVLCSEPQIEVSGSGEELVNLQLVPRDGLLPVFEVLVEKDEFGVEHPLHIELTCADFGTEMIHYIITAQVHVAFLPAIMNGNLSTSAASETTAETSASRAAAASLPRMQMGAWGPWTYQWVFAGTNDARLYNQIQAGTAPNTSSCYSGCGATAWGMLFGWADYQARSSNSWDYWKPRFGIYRQNGGYGADAIAPQYADAGVNSMIWEIRGHIGTFCVGSSGPTFPWDMGNAWRYLSGRSGARVVTHYNVVGISEDRLRDYAIRSIRDRRTPAIIGTGWLNHYPLAMGYAWRSRTVKACAICWWDTTETSRWFWVNQGWGGSGNGWVSASTWFAGELYP